VIIELEKYNEVGELLIENGTTGLWGHVCYWDRGWRVSITMVAVCMRVKEMDVNRTQGRTQLVSKLGMRAGMHTTAVEQSKKYQHAIRWKYIERKRVGTLRSQVH